jgi:molybdopterin converting factor subunit 1
MEKTARKYRIKAFGIAREIMGGKELAFESKAENVGVLREELMETFPKLRALRSFFIAVNSSYAGDDTRLQETDEIALIPPVSGG